MKQLIEKLIETLQERNEIRKEKNLPPEQLTTGKLIEILQTIKI